MKTLQEMGLPVGEAAATGERDEKKTERRRRLLRALVEDDGWQCSNVTAN